MKATPKMASSRWSLESCLTLCSCFECSTPCPPWLPTRTWRYTLTFTRSLFPGLCRTLRAPGGQPGWSLPRAAGGAMASAPLSTVIHSLAPQLLRFPSSSGCVGFVRRGTLICRAVGRLLSRSTWFLALGLARVTLDQWPLGLGGATSCKGNPRQKMS